MSRSKGLDPSSRERFRCSASSVGLASPTGSQICGSANWPDLLPAVDDDFDTPGALAVLFDYIREQNRSNTPPGPTAAVLLQEIYRLIENLRIDRAARDDREIGAAVERRRQLRTNRRFAEADAIRTDLAQPLASPSRTLLMATRWWRPRDN